MKLSKKSSIRVLIRKQGSKAAHITLEDTTIEEAVQYVKDVLRPSVDPFAEGRVTSITVSKAVPNDGDTSITFSFKGMEPEEVKVMICASFVSTEA